MKYDKEQDMNEYREEDIKNNKIHKSVEVRITANITETCWQEFEDITEANAIEYAKEGFLDIMPSWWKVVDIEVETLVYDDGD